MSSEADKTFFERLGSILNAPLPGTRSNAPAADGQVPADHEADGLLERIKDILNQPLPGTQSAESDAPSPAPSLEPPASPAGGPAGRKASDARAELGGQPLPPSASTEAAANDLDEDWWERDWEAFRGHQERERKAFATKQRGDQEKFAAYQEQEKAHFDVHQQQEAELFKRQQQWKLNVWKSGLEAARHGHPPPPPPFPMPPPGPPIAGGPMPPWLRPPGTRRR